MAHPVRILLVLSMAVAMTALVLFAARDRDSGEPLALSPAAAPTQAVAPTATPGLAFEPVVPEWVAVASELEGPQAVPQLFVVKTETGEMWRLGDPPVPGAQVSLWPLVWSPDGELLVSVRTQDGADLYLAEPGSPFEIIATIDAGVGVAAWSPEGKTVALDGVDARLLSMATGEIMHGPPLSGTRVINWSGDGKFVAFATGPLLEPEVVVWEWTSGRTERIEARSGVWSHEGARLAYVPARDVTLGEIPPHEIRVRDFNAGLEEIVTTIVTVAAEPVGWSADDSLIMVAANTDIFTTYIVSADGQGGTVAVHGTWPSNWLGDEQRVLLTGNVCRAYDIATVDGDGSDLKHHTETEIPELNPRASPDGERVVFSVLRRDEPSVIRMLTLATGEMRDLAVGSALSLFQNVIRPELVWSPDGRYVAFGVAGGHDFCLGFPPQTTTVELLP